MAEAGSTHTVTVGEMVTPFDEPQGLCYLQSPVTVTATAANGVTAYEAHIDHSALNANQLLAVLSEVAPHDKQQGAYDVWSDWQLTDETRNEELIAIHEELGRAWETFVRSLPVFKRVIRDAVTPDFEGVEGVNVYGGHPAALYREEQLERNIHEVVEELSFDTNPLPYIEVALLASAEVESPRAGALAALQTALKQHPKASEIEDTDRVEQRLGELDPADRYSVLFSLVQSLTPSQQSAVVEQVKTLYKSIELGGSRYFISPHIFQGDLQAVMRDTITARVWRHTVEIARMAIKDRAGMERERVFVVPGSQREVEPLSSILPRVRWTKDAQGKRNFILPTNEEQATEAARQYVSDVAGVLLVAYLSPEERRKWPKEIAIVHDGKRTHPMQLAAAQVPVVALFPGVRRKLLDSPFIQAAEDSAAEVNDTRAWAAPRLSA